MGTLEEGDRRGISSPADGYCFQYNFLHPTQRQQGNRKVPAPHAKRKKGSELNHHFRQNLSPVIGILLGSVYFNVK